MHKFKVKKAYSLIEDDLKMVQEKIFASLKSNEPLINKIGEHILSSPGKMVRPSVLLLFSRIFDYNGFNHLKMAAAVELIHVGTLVHDDVIDHNDMRRFKPTANSIWDNSLSVLTGDYIFCAAFKLMVECGSLKCLDILANTLSIIVSGEVSQLARQKSKRVISRDEYYKIAQAKTAELFMAACHIPAILTNQSNDTEKCVLEIGRNIGILFQVIDDTIDYFCDSETIGKERFNDFFEGKFTIPVIELLDCANTSEKELIKELITNEANKTKDHAHKILEMMDKYKIKNVMITLSRDMQKEIEELMMFLPQSHITQHIRYLLDYLISKVL